MEAGKAVKVLKAIENAEAGDTLEPVTPAFFMKRVIAVHPSRTAWAGSDRFLRRNPVLPGFLERWESGRYNPWLNWNFQDSHIRL